MICFGEGDRVLFFDRNRKEHIVDNEGKDHKPGYRFHLANEDLCIWNASKVWIRSLRNIGDSSHDIVPKKLN